MTTPRALRRCRAAEAISGARLESRCAIAPPHLAGRLSCGTLAEPADNLGRRARFARGEGSRLTYGSCLYAVRRAVA
ncbi:hypothetical protein GCM10028781_16060 [Nostocoides australiense]